jgi:uncharacterized metal-binding protein
LPNRATHQVLSIISGAVALPTIFFLDATQFLSLMSGIAVTAALPEFTPDLDINARHFGWLGDWAGLKAYSQITPHRYGFKKRHWTRLRIWNIFFLSHVPFLGTSLRTLLLLLPFSVLLILLQWMPTNLPTIILFMWLGMSWSDLWHVIADNPFKNHETSKDYWNKRKYHGMGRVNKNIKYID